MFEKLLINIKKAYSVVLFEQDFRDSILYNRKVVYFLLHHHIIFVVAKLGYLKHI